MIKVTFFLFAFHIFSSALFSWAALYYVSPDGDNNNPGTLSQPWATIQKAADTITAGSTVYVRGGVYNEQVTINVSGSSAGGYISFQNYQGEKPVVDGSNFTVPSGAAGLFLIENKNYIVLKGFEIRNYSSSTKNIVPAGIHVRGTSHHIELRNNHIHHIETHAPVNSAGQDADAHGISVYGTSAPESINNLIIDGNELYDLILGSSEALALNGNVETFQVTNNTVRDTNNIAIDCIGFEGTSPDSAYDQARNGEISGNKVYNISSYGNPSYGAEYSAGGIYVDGGRDIIVQRNVVTLSDIGIEIASEHSGRATSNITVSNNIIYNNKIAGIAMGGYDDQRGSTRDCKVINNTLYHNDTRMDGNGELLLQFDIKNNIIKNNIFNANSQSILISNLYPQNTGSVVDYNLYFSPEESENSTWQWMGITYIGFDSYRAGTSGDANGLFANPKFINPSEADFHLQQSSPAIDKGSSINAPSNDFDGNLRPQGAGYDLGAYEYVGIPIPDIKANSQDGSFTVSSGTPVSITVSLNPNNLSGQNADWWVVESAPDGFFYHFDLATSSMVQGLLPTHQGPLFTLNPSQLLNTSGLTVGKHTFYFAVDMNMNGSLDFNQLYFDAVVVNVTQ